MRSIFPHRQSMNLLRQSIPVRYVFGLLSVLLVTAAATAAIDRNPQLKSRPYAWGDSDGQYLVDPNSRADMLNFWHTVLSKPYPYIQWTGSIDLQLAGTCSEAWRVREYAQLNAYRALNNSLPMVEDSDALSLVQEGALVLALNPDKEQTHIIDTSWVGYTETRAYAVEHSLLGGGDDYSTGCLLGSVDGFIWDATAPNLNGVGHRTALLEDANLKGAVGAARPTTWKYAYNAVWNANGGAFGYQITQPENFIAWPAPGYMPIALFKRWPSLRWSFVVQTSNTSYWADNVVVTAKINGADAPVSNVHRNGGAWPVTWSFDKSVFDPDTVTDGTTVEITISNVQNVPYPGDGTLRTYCYTVTFFDESVVKKVSFSPQTPFVGISTRGKVEADTRQMVAGFYVTGTVPVRVALRTQGPSLAKYGITNPAQKTRLKLYDQSGNLLGENAGWKTHQDWRLLESLSMNPDTENEAAMVATLWPGLYTAEVSDDTGANGVGIVEAYNIDNLTTGRLSGLSTRGVVGMDQDQLVAGINIKDQARTLLIRTQGPGLTRYGVSGVVSDTVLSIIPSGGGDPIATNDDWRSDARNARLATDLASMAPSDEREAALIITLQPGIYTALVSGKTDTGVGIVEIYELD